jgi:hypothetical protein
MLLPWLGPFHPLPHRARRTTPPENLQCNTPIRAQKMAHRRAYLALPYHTFPFSFPCLLTYVADPVTRKALSSRYEAGPGYQMKTWRWTLALKQHETTGLAVIPQPNRNPVRLSPVPVLHPGPRRWRSTPYDKMMMVSSLSSSNGCSSQ